MARADCVLKKRYAVFLGVPVLALLFGAGCPQKGGGPTPVTVKVQGTDCDVKDLKITFTVEEQDSGGAKSLVIKANATCKGAPLDGAKLIVSAGSVATALTTDPQGNASATSSVYPNSLIGQQGTVTVTGNDGTTISEGTVTVTKAP